MSLHILDTDILSHLRHGNEEICRRIIALPASDLAVTIVTVEESLMGWCAKIRRAKDEAAVVRAYQSLQQAVEYLRGVRILPFDSPSAAIARLLRSQHRRIGLNDIRIAAIVLSHGATLVTRNTKDFSRISELSVEDWSGS